MKMRHSTHATDTRAVRKVITQLPDDWLIRGLEERDYGIDLFIEIFNEEYATGQTAMIQVKGTEKRFSKEAKLSFPTKTIEYALLFQQPFFVFHVSLEQKSIRYLWLQKYVDMVLDVQKPDWRKQGKVTIKFPKENKLPKNHGKISEILKKSMCRDEAVRITVALRLARQAWDSRQILTTPEAILFLEKQISEIKKCKRFWESYDLPNFAISDIDVVLQEMRSNIAAYGSDETQLEYQNSELVKDFDEYFIEIGSALEIYQEEVIGDDFAYEVGGVIPF